MMRLTVLLFLAFALYAGEPQFSEVERWVKAGDLDKLRAALGADKLTQGTAYFAEGPNFLFAVETPGKPQIIIDEDAPRPMQKTKKGSVWFSTAKLKTSRTHNFSYVIGGKPFGGAENAIAFGPYSYPMPGVPQGKLDGKHVFHSKIYPGMQCDYWVYAPAAYDGRTPAAVMIWQDGEVLVNREMPSRAQIVFDNLTHQKKIPVIVHILISPGFVGKTRIRSEQYDTMDDRYARFLRDEMIPEISKTYRLRTDAYSRAVAGDSSGGICAFNAAYTHPELFSRVLSRVGSFTSIQWHPGKIDGGNVYPFKLRKEPKKNIRVFLQEGALDLENEHGSWPAQNLAMANSLKKEGYDFFLSWGNGSHTRNGGHAELAEEMLWLWRGYDPAKTEQTFLQDPAEKDKPFFRIRALNRETPLP